MGFKNFINIFKKSVKWFALFLFGIFLFIFALNRLERKFGHKKVSGSEIKNKKTFGFVIKPKKIFSNSNAGNSKNSLKDIFNIPDKKYKKFNRLFISPEKINNNGMKVFANASRPGGVDLPNFIKKLKFKGFSEKKSSPPSLIFISGKTALLRADGRSYYVRAGENIKGMFILKVGLTGVSYSDKGKIKYLNF
ncbi:MAG: hypothetical protein M0034_03590 [Deltaproteobacteria bacterium]|jgi:hypothetical protein|nr:hypothetical protein [Deltaproteobacteria bacterium]